MNAGWNRPGRKYRGSTRAKARQLALAAIAALAAPGLATAAQATTGGATTAAAEKAGAGSGLAFGPLRSASASWYGPGLYGNRTACGQTLRPRTMGVAHKRLPCGTPVKFLYRGRQVVTRVIDRGPFVRGKSWDLTNGVRKALRFEGIDRVRYAIGIVYTRKKGGAARSRG